MHNIDYTVIDILQRKFKGYLVRICSDSYNKAFSYHVFGKDDREIGYIIPDISYTLIKIDREWGEPNKRRSRELRL